MRGRCAGNIVCTFNRRSLLMTQIALKKFAIELRWALIFSLMYLVWMLTERLAGFHDIRLDQQSMVGPLILIPSIIIYGLMLRDRKRSLEGKMTYSQGFLSGCMLTVFVVILSPLNQLLTLKIISPDYFANLIEYTVAQGALTPEQARQQFSIGNYVATGLIAGALTGILFSAILAAFMRSRGTHNQRRPAG
jgi:hypothetical protein